MRVSLTAVPALDDAVVVDERLITHTGVRRPCTNTTAAPVTCAASSSCTEPSLVRHVPDGGRPVTDVLSLREREVLQLLAEGKTSKQIASILFVSPKTVETHRAQIMDKLGIRTVAELTKFAIRQGLTSVD